MKIALACRVYANHQRVGGLIHVVVERAEQLVREGHEVHVLTTLGPTDRKLEVINGVIVHPCLTNAQQYSDEYANFCVDWCKKLQPHILHLDSWDKNRCWWHTRPGSPKAIAVSNHGEGIGSHLTSWRLSIHGQSTRGELLNTNEWLAERNCLLKADVVIATCRFDRWLLSDLLGLGGKVKLVYNPLAPYHFENRVEPPVINKFLCIGVWGHSERGFKLAEAACAEAGAELVVPMNVSRKELVPLYDQCKALLLPSYQSQGFDLSVAETIARRRPVIYSDAGVATMEAIDQPWFVLTPVGDQATLLQKIKSKLPSVPEMAADKHRPEAHVKKWLEAIHV